MSDQWRSLPSGLGFAGEARRERPVVDMEAIGPWQAKVTVTRVVGVGWEVSASWTGPPLEVAGRPDVHHLVVVGDDVPAPAPVLANDVVYTGEDGPLARAIALRAADELRAPKRPNLPALAAELKRRRS